LTQDAAELAFHTQAPTISDEEINTVLQQRGYAPIFSLSPAGDSPTFVPVGAPSSLGADPASCLMPGDPLGLLVGPPVLARSEPIVSLQDVLSRPVPRPPVEVAVGLHWAAVAGAQPLTPENPPIEQLAAFLAAERHATTTVPAHLLHLGSGAQAVSAAKRQVEAAVEAAALAATATDSAVDLDPEVQADLRGLLSKFEEVLLEPWISAPADVAAVAPSFTPGLALPLGTSALAARPPPSTAAATAFPAESASFASALDPRRVPAPGCATALRLLASEPGLSPVIAELLSFLHTQLRALVCRATERRLRPAVAAQQAISTPLIDPGTIALCASALVDNPHLSLLPVLHVMLPLVMSLAVNGVLDAADGATLSVRRRAAAVLARLSGTFSPQHPSLPSKLAETLAGGLDAALTAPADSGDGVDVSATESAQVKSETANSSAEGADSLVQSCAEHDRIRSIIGCVYVAAALGASTSRITMLPRLEQIAGRLGPEETARSVAAFAVAADDAPMTGDASAGPSKLETTRALLVCAAYDALRQACRTVARGVSLGVSSDELLGMVAEGGPLWPLVAVFGGESVRAWMSPSVERGHDLNTID
jgi:hypothetical protein